MNKDAYQKFRDMLLQLRRAAGLTQSELSQLLSRPQSFVSKYERGERRLDVVELADIAKALNVDPAKLLASFYREME